MEITNVINLQYNANTYLLRSKKASFHCYLIDIGNSEVVLLSLKEQEKIKAIFLTHAHYDHICGINEILEHFPDCIIYCSEYTSKALSDSKLNLSFYHKTPVSYSGPNVKILADGDFIQLFDGLDVQVLETPGHNAGSLSFKIENNIFAGDSLIPEFSIVTKLKSGNKLQATESIIKIKNHSTTSTTIFPGHGKSFLAGEIDWNFYLSK